MSRQTTSGSQALLSRREFLRRTASLGTITGAITFLSGGRSRGTATAASLSLPLNTWVSRPVPIYPGSPGPYYSKHIRLAYDPSRSLIYFWGGDYCVVDEVYQGSRCNSREEFWSYDVATDTWMLLVNQTQGLNPAFPKGRCISGFTYDPKRSVVWMTGGQVRFGDYPSPGPQDGGLWAFNPATRLWSREGPDPREGGVHEVHFMAYDPVNDGLFITDDGKMQFYPLGQVVIGDGREQNFWTELPFPVNDPYLVGYNILHAVDTRRNRAVIYAPRNGETWAYDFTMRTVTRLNQQKLPMMANFTMVYDSVNDLVALWGGGTDYDPNLRDLWVFNHQTNQWSKPVISGDPTGAAHAQMVFDPLNNAIVLYGEKIHLLRLGLGSTPPDTMPPAAPTNLRIQ